MKQEYTSENTSINKTKVPAVFKKAEKEFREGHINIDIGGGKFDTATQYLAQKGVINVIYDPYNRSAEHNKEVLKMVNIIDGANSATCSNVLNVIKEDAIILETVKMCYDCIRDGGTSYFTVYEGNKSGIGKASCKGWQRNERLSDYKEFIKQVFGNVTQKNNVLFAKKCLTSVVE